MTMNKVLVYGTLRTGGDTPTVTIYGYKMFDLGWYPGVVYSGNVDDTIVCELHEVGDDTLQQLDAFEGYYKDDLDNSLYLRRNYGLIVTECELYVYNRQVRDHPRIPSGDWLKHRGEEAGSNAHRLAKEETENAL